MSFMAVIPPDSSDRLSIKSQYIAIPERRKVQTSDLLRTWSWMLSVEDDRQYRAPHIHADLVVSRYETSG
ncbi:hypothetical protein F511_42111 [Dorcoceras hygrometricum]|uniref:Uncharacterized protein n=1 Tax=Dorcoceras hygrometricum TaxID=472368 RepID=A0A2Z6ZZ93_9LAMI|nr:hypothetical protein F511_42111 [Dorcoceras hygrometricum]